MNQEEQQKLTNEASLAEAKKNKSEAITNALLIGVMIGIIAWSILKNTVGLFTLIPLFFIYKLVNGKNDTESKKDLAE